MDPLAIIAIIIGGGGLFTGIAALIKSASEARQSAKKTEFDILRGTIEDMQKQIAALRAENAELRSTIATQARRITDLESENHTLRARGTRRLELHD